LKEEQCRRIDDEEHGVTTPEPNAAEVTGSQLLVQAQ
jgi:hypothetical protein